MKKFYQIDLVLSGWMAHHGFLLLRLSLSLVFIWFGLLKTFGESPAQELVAQTVYWFDPKIFVPILGWWEVAIGFFMLFRRFIRFAILLLFIQMPGTFLPLAILPEVCFTYPPFGLTIEGQYIIKNLVLISAAIVVGGTVRYDELLHRPRKL